MGAYQHQHQHEKDMTLIAAKNSSRTPVPCARDSRWMVNDSDSSFVGFSFDLDFDLDLRLVIGLAGSNPQGSLIQEAVQQSNHDKTFD